MSRDGSPQRCWMNSRRSTDAESKRGPKTATITTRKRRTNRSHQHQVGRVFDQFRLVAPGIRALRKSLDRKDKAIRSIVHLASHIRTRFSWFDRPHKASTVHQNRFAQRVCEDCERGENDRIHAVNRFGIDSNRIEAIVRSRRSIVHRN